MNLLENSRPRKNIWIAPIIVKHPVDQTENDK
jgi:hypothetical protein